LARLAGAAFHLYVKDAGFCAKDFEDLSKCRQLLACKRLCAGLPTSRKPMPDINLAEFFRGELANKPIDQSGSVKRGVMDNYWYVVARESYVKLNPVCAVANCARKCSQRIFRSHCRSSAMAQD